MFRNDAPFGAEDWDRVEACFGDDRLTALNIRSRDVYEENLEDWMEEYGPPDRVTWGEEYYNRSIIWAEEGILIVTDVQYYSEGTGRLILFVPIPRNELESSWLIASLPSRSQGFTDGEAPDAQRLPPRLEQEDPWDIER